MNVLVYLVPAIFVAVVAEPPRFRGGRFRPLRQELAPFGEGEREKIFGKYEEAPYSAAGFRPIKEFRIPVRQEIVGPPATSYGVPADSYGVPLHLTAPPVLQTEYGLPERRGKSEREDERREEGEFGERREGLREGGERREGGEGREGGNREEHNEREGGEERLEVEGLLREGGRGEPRERLRDREESEGGEGNAEVVSSQGAYYVLLPNAQVQRVQFRTENDLRNMAYTARLHYRTEDRAPVYIYPRSSSYLQLV